MTTAAKELFNDLLSLEVNIIVKRGMTARKMPDVPHALLDIFSDYDLWLCRQAVLLNEAWSRFLGRPAAAAFESAPPAGTQLVEGGKLIAGLDVSSFFDTGTTVNADAFDKLRGEARQAEEMYGLLVTNGLLEDDGSPIILKRIYRNCDQIKAILQGRGLDGGDSNAKLKRSADKGISRGSAKVGDVPLAADEMLTIRKAWEVGTETVLMQTVAQLDGDVITRVQQARLTAGDKPLHDLHQAAVGNALQHWQFLVNTFVQITTRAAGFLAR